MELGDILGKVMGLITVGVGLGAFTEVFVEYFVKPLVQMYSKRDDLVKGLTIKYLALVVGFVISLFANYDLFTPLLNEFGLYPWPFLGPILSAITVGGGAPFIHAWIEKWRGGKSLRTTGIRSP